MTSLMSACLRCAATLRSALAATAAASRPKLLVLNLICRSRDSGHVICLPQHSAPSRTLLHEHANPKAALSVAMWRAAGAVACGCGCVESADLGDKGSRGQESRKDLLCALVGQEVSTACQVDLLRIGTRRACTGCLLLQCVMRGRELATAAQLLRHAPLRCRPWSQPPPPGSCRQP